MAVENMKHLISMKDISREEIECYLSVAKRIEEGTITPSLRGKVAGLLFFEPSTRTHFSFSSAMQRLGGGVLSLSGSDGSSQQKGESFHDTVMTIAQYSDIIVIRSAMEGAARYVADKIKLPVINAGDGGNQHPTQALLDLYTMKKLKECHLEGATVGLMGDLRYGRTIHSLVFALSLYGIKFYLISPKHLRIPSYLKKDLREREVDFQETFHIEEVINKLDILYVTRLQKERFSDLEEYEKSRGSYKIKASMLKEVKKEFKVMHPLPRVDEVDKSVDDTPYAHYFQQAKNGMFARQAIFAIHLGAV